MIITLALRNLLRNRRRTSMTLLAMVVGLASILIFGGYVRNSALATQTGYVQYQGHLQIQHKGYFSYGNGNPAAYGISDYQKIIDAVKSDELLSQMVVVITPVLQLNGVAGNFENGASIGVIASGVVAKDQNQMRQWDDYGGLSYTRPIALVNTPADSVVIGTGVARMLHLCSQLKLNDCPSPKELGSTQPTSSIPTPASIAALSSLEQENIPHSSAPTIDVLAATPNGAPNVVSLNVMQAENWGVKEINDSLIVLHLDQAQRLVFGGLEAKVTAIQIQLRHTSQIPQARKRLNEILQKDFRNLPLETLDFETLTPIYKQILQFFDSIFGFISILIVIIVLFTVINTMNMAVVERTVEIGTLRAIGQRRTGIRNLFICEGLMLGILGAIIGILITLPISYLINHSNFIWIPPGYSHEYPVMVRVWEDKKLILSSSLSLVLVSVISAWRPASQASKLKIVEALRHA